MVHSPTVLPSAETFKRMLRQTKLPTAPLAKFSDVGHCLVLCSGSPVLLNELIALIRKQAQGAFITIIAPAHLATNLQAFKSMRTGIRLQSVPGRLEWEWMRDLVIDLDFDTLVAIFNTVWGSGYGNILRICRRLELDKWLAYNCHRKLLMLDHDIIQTQHAGIQHIHRLADQWWQHLMLGNR